MRWLVLCLVVLGICAAKTAGQSSQPSGDPWSELAQEFANAIGQGDATALVPLLTEKVSIDCFDSHGGDAVRLLARIKGATLIAARAYPHGAATMATDLAAEISSSAIPDDLKRRMMLPDPQQARRANDTATLWVSETLASKGDDPVGVALFWCVAPNASDGSPGKSELIFILFRGDPSRADRPRIAAIAFGDPLNQTH